MAQAAVDNRSGALALYQPPPRPVKRKDPPSVKTETRRRRLSKELSAWIGRRLLEHNRACEKTVMPTTSQRPKGGVRRIAKLPESARSSMALGDSVGGPTMPSVLKKPASASNPGEQYSELALHRTRAGSHTGGDEWMFGWHDECGGYIGQPCCFQHVASTVHSGCRVRRAPATDRRIELPFAGVELNLCGKKRTQTVHRYIFTLFFILT